MAPSFDDLAKEIKIEPGDKLALHEKGAEIVRRKILSMESAVVQPHVVVSEGQIVTVRDRTPGGMRAEEGKIYLETVYAVQVARAFLFGREVDLFSGRTPEQSPSRRER